MKHPAVRAATTVIATFAAFSVGLGALGLLLIVLGGSDGALGGCGGG